MLHRSIGLGRSLRPLRTQSSRLVLYDWIQGQAPVRAALTFKKCGAQVGNFSTSLRRLDRPRGEEQSSSNVSQVTRDFHPRKSTTGRLFLGLAIGLASVSYISGTFIISSSDKQVLDDQKFIPYRVTSTEVVSSTAFILTVKPDLGHLTPTEASAQLNTPWQRYDLWSVEIKQPQLQIARQYTPLPPLPKSHSQVGLRFLIRTVDGGEVSTYLSKLLVGSQVQLRGPHGGFDLNSRLGDEGEEVVFLAGGTGIASAMQAAYSLLDDQVQLGGSKKVDKEPPRVSIVWAVRKREDVQFPSQPPRKSRSWNPFERSEAQSNTLFTEFENPSLISEQLLAMKEKYGEKLGITFVVDEENTYITESDLRPALQRTNQRLLANKSAMDEQQNCQYHCQAMHISMADGDPNSGRKDQQRIDDCACRKPDTDRQPGKNLLLVSGPDGFIAAYTGAKKWEGGGQIQGTLGGLVGDLQRRYPDVWKDWVVLKL